MTVEVRGVFDTMTKRGLVALRLYFGTTEYAEVSFQYFNDNSELKSRRIQVEIFLHW